MMDEASGDSYASVTFLADELKGMIRDIMGDATGGFLSDLIPIIIAEHRNHIMIPCIIRLIRIYPDRLHLTLEMANTA